MMFVLIVLRIDAIEKRICNVIVTSKGRCSVYIVDECQYKRKRLSGNRIHIDDKNLQSPSLDPVYSWIEFWNSNWNCMHVIVFDVFIYRLFVDKKFFHWFYSLIYDLVEFNKTFLNFCVWDVVIKLECVVCFWCANTWYQELIGSTLSYLN